LLWTLSAPGQSDADRASARELFFQARAAFEAKDYARAAELFERSNQLYPAPTAALGLARSLAEAGKLVSAYERYRALAAMRVPSAASRPFKRAVTDAQSELAALEKRLPALVIHVRGSSQPTVTIDGETLPAAALGVKRFVDPGTHDVSATATGFARKTERVSVAEGEAREISIELRALPGSAPPPQPPPRSATADARVEREDGMTGMQTAGLVVGGVGGVSLIAAAVTGGLYLSRKSTVDEHCTEVDEGQFECDEAAGPDAASEARTFGMINAATLVVGVLATGTGITLFVLGGRRERSVSLRAGVGQFSVGGRF
jgi:hypothetical protein